MNIKEGVEKFLSEGTGVLKIELFLSFVEPFCYFSKVLYLFNYLFLVALGLHSCVWAFSSGSMQGLFFAAVHGLLIVVTSLAVEHRL